MTRPVLVAVPGPAEAELVRTLDLSGEIVVVHRCVDLAELLALGGAGHATAAFVGVDLPQLDLDAVARLRHDGLAVIGVHTRDPADGPRRPSGLGFSATVAADATAAELVEAIDAALAQPQQHLAAVMAGDPLDGLDEFDLPAESPTVAAGGAGQVVAVWGPAGSPGRTTVALTLAAELADRGDPALLADADTYAASIAQLLGVLDEAPGLAAACRAAATGTLDLVGLARLSPLVSARLRVLTGITRSDRWPELSGPAMEQVLRVARGLASWVVVDVGFCLEQDEELSYDTFAPRRNGAALVALHQADQVVAVGSADPIGLQRLIRGLAELDALGVRPSLVVATKVRAGAVGGNPGRRVRDALTRYAGLTDVLLVPDDRDALDGAVLAGRSLIEHAPDSPARIALAELATAVGARVTPVPAP